MRLESLGKVVDARQKRMADEALGLADARHALEGDELAGPAEVRLAHHEAPRALEHRRHHEDLEALAQHRGKAVNGNRHDLPPLPVRLLHTGYGSIPGMHGC